MRLSVHFKNIVKPAGQISEPIYHAKHIFTTLNGLFVGWMETLPQVKCVQSRTIITLFGCFTSI
ncbi:hypothetical protein Dform_02011 [Dehalogenimonas formicexedens]|uniref:Uncharacterized protein n=1 Tax=Dehalogenimonas formicexedens TaxID=1839801 RepID=A0A1P8FA49_9CHLR|nr:hypothetical protein Dform_02011 [Dehalogenimonas formicexedens]